MYILGGDKGAYECPLLVLLYIFNLMSKAFLVIQSNSYLL